MGTELEVVVSLDAERPSHCPHRWLGPWPLAVPTRASPQCLTRTHAPQSGCMAVLGYRCTAFNWGAISRPQASYTGLHPTDARSKSEYSLTHSLTHSLSLGQFCLGLGCCKVFNIKILQVPSSHSLFTAPGNGGVFGHDKQSAPLFSGLKTRPYRACE